MEENTKIDRSLPRSMPPELERLATLIVHSAYTVHKALGAGLLESIYEPCFCHELGKREVALRRQVVVPLVYDTLKFEEGLRLDVLVADQIICEIKAVEALLPVDQAQLLTYMKLTQKRLGFLVNFNVPLIKNGIKRLAL